jgi:hypothetical protein
MIIDERFTTILKSFCFRGLSNRVGINVFDTGLPLKKASKMVYMIFEDSIMALRSFLLIRKHMGVINDT